METVPLFSLHCRTVLWFGIAFYEIPYKHVRAFRSVDCKTWFHAIYTFWFVLYDIPQRCFADFFPKNNTFMWAHKCCSDTHINVLLVCIYMAARSQLHQGISGNFGEDKERRQRSRQRTQARQECTRLSNCPYLPLRRSGPTGQLFNSIIIR